MKKFILSGLIAFGMLTAQCQVLLNEIQTNGDDIVEIKNHGDMMVDISTYRLCSWPTYSTVGTMTVISGSTTLMPGAIVVLSGHNMGDNDDELGLYLDNSWTNPASMLDYVEWGSTGHTRSSVAQSAGIWANGDFTEAAPMGTTLAWDGDGNSSANWTVGAEPSFGQENPNGGGGCEGVLGCIDPTACNYDSTADCDDGSCTVDDACGVCGGAGTVAGCTDTTACNYDSLADCDDGSCTVDDACGVCGGAGTIAGCTDSAACNYDSTADCDDGSCVLPDGCTDSTACNYDSSATCDDGTCLFPGDECDDGDPNSLGDVYLEDCSCSGVVGIEEEVKTTITIYPNPTEGLIQIQTIETVLGVQIYDLAGRLVFESNNKTFNISSLPVGIYTLRIRTENGLTITRVSKN